MRAAHWNRVIRGIQDLAGPRAGALIQVLLGPSGTRVLRALMGRSAGHHEQIRLPKRLIGVGNNDAWVICPDLLPSGGIVYSLGVGNEIRFDLDLIEKFNVDVFAFDPTPESVAWVKAQALPAKFHFIEYGIADFDGYAQFDKLGGIQYGMRAVGKDRCPTLNLEVHRLSTTMKRLGHSRIDLLKINIEGGEYAVIADMVASSIEVGQLVVEFHHRLPGFDVSQTITAVRQLNAGNYKIFHIAESEREYSFATVVPTI